MSQLLLFVFVGLVSLIVQCCVLGEIFPFEYKPDLSLLVVIWLGINSDYFFGLFSVFILGIVVDMLSGAPAGLFSVIYLLAFIFSAYVGQNFDVERLGSGWSVTILTCFLVFCLCFLARWLSGQIVFEALIVKIIIFKTILTTLGLIVVKPLLDGIWKGYCKVIGA